MSYRIDLTPNASYTETVSVSQDDVGREIAIDLYQDGTAYTIPSGTTITMQGTKPSGLGYTITGTNGTTSVTFLTTAAMTQESGRFASELVLTNGTTVIGTANFALYVEKNPHPAETIDGTHETMQNLTVRMDALEDDMDALEGTVTSKADASTVGALADTIDSIQNSLANASYVPNVTWVNRYLNSTNGSLGGVAANRVVSENLIDISGYDRISWNADDLSTNGATIAFFDAYGAFIETKYVASPPYDINSASIAKIRILFGNSTAIDASTFPNAVMLSHKTIDDVELLPLSDTSRTIMLIGDSITQGAGSTGFIIYNDTIDGVTYSVRGNGPNYPGAGSGYQVGTFLYQNSGRMWYEALNGNGWAQKLKAYYESKFNCSVLNYGMTGIDSGNLEGFIQTLVLDSSADIVILMIGTNDRGNTTKQVFFQNVFRAVRKIIESGKKVIVMASIPASVTNETAYSYHMEDVEHILFKVAKLAGCKFISLYELFMDYCDLKGITIDSLLADGLHPSDAGYEVMFKLITKELGLNRKRPDATW